MSPVFDGICNIKTKMMPLIAIHFLNWTIFTPWTENIYKIIFINLQEYKGSL